jgi:hypothetical protein
MDCSTRKGGKVKEVTIGIRKKIHKEKKQIEQQQKFSLLDKSSGLISLAPYPGFGFWCSGLCGEGCCSSYQTAWDRDGWRVFSLFFLLTWSYEPSIASRSMKWSHRVMDL